ncbi:helix-turn-helix domain containing protein [Brevibacterium sp. BRM-1]|uniref:TetR/AcrR family transcriptional regulator n=1 Tax=Brevibacterium sp. BRM-1 TaxID=2999062 RepID=UPI00228150E4|nr:TetR/AcrR family transcriptional regulator [Brevibacterium sp. BRM-1]WAL39493.1 helix-turn-helix domain containing protein [Brevibacterium sp. BRM-1]
MFNERVQDRGARRAQTEDAVLAAARDLFREAGYAGTTIRQIAQRAGVSVGTVMGVGDKSALLVRSFEDWIAQVHAERTAAGASAAGAVRAAGGAGGKKGTRKRVGASRPLAPVDAVMALFAPFIEYFGQDLELSRAYAAVLVAGPAPGAGAESFAAGSEAGAGAGAEAGRPAIFGSLGRALLGEIVAVLKNAGLAHPKRRARALYYAYLGVLLTAASGAVAYEDVTARVREAVAAILGGAR